MTYPVTLVRHILNPVLRHLWASRFGMDRFRLRN
jgi:hypothetical protein